MNNLIFKTALIAGLFTATTTASSQNSVKKSNTLGEQIVTAIDNLRNTIFDDYDRSQRLNSIKANQQTFVTFARNIAAARNKTTTARNATTASSQKLKIDSYRFELLKQRKEASREPVKKTTSLYKETELNYQPWYCNDIKEDATYPQMSIVDRLVRIYNAKGKTFRIFNIIGNEIYKGEIASNDTILEIKPDLAPKGVYLLNVPGCTKRATFRD